MSFTGKVKNHIVQIAKNWPTDDSGWQSMPYWSASSAAISLAGNGSASFTGHAGKIYDPVTGRKDFLNLEESPVGSWCRIIVEDSISGTITISGVKYRAVWHGIVKQRKIKPTAGDLPSVDVSMSAAWITAAYEACDILHSWELDFEDNLTESYAMPVFNLLDGGDMSANDDSIIDGIFTYVFERSGDATYAQRWTYAAAMKYLCCTARPWVPPQALGEKTGPRLILGDYPAALDSAPLPQKSGRGRNVIEWMRSIIHPGMGCALAFRVDGEDIKVDIKPCAQVDIPLLDGSLVAATLPNPFDASGLSIDLNGDPTTFNAEIVESDDAEDYILTVGGPDIYGISLKVSDGEALIPCGWDWTDTPGDPAQDPFGDVFRLYKINPEWLGEQWASPGEGMPATIVHDVSGTNGSRQFGGVHPANATLQITRDLPWGPSETTSARSTPRLFLGPASGQTEWEDLTTKIPIIPLKDGLVRLGQTTAHAEILKEAYDNNQEIILSIGVEGWHPLLAAWRRSSAKPRDLPRVRRIDLPQCSTETGLVGTAQAVDQDDGSLKIATSETVREDDIAGLRNALACAQAKSQTNSVTLTMRTVGSMAQRFDLGDPILDLQYGKSPNQTTVEIKAIVTSMTLDFSAERFGISYEALRVLG